MTERVRTLLFAAAKGVEAFAAADIVQRMWEKLVHLSTAAAMTCLMRANVGEIVRTPNGGELFLDQLQCGAAIPAANGHAPSEGFMRSWEETFSQQESQYATSMLRDVERGGPTEVEHILGFMLNKARGQYCAPDIVARLHAHQGFRAAACRRPFVLISRNYAIRVCVTLRYECPIRTVSTRSPR
jgi:ketopantoate reductase